MRAIGLGCLRAVGARDTIYLLLHGTGDVCSREVGVDRAKVLLPDGQWGRPAGVAAIKKAYTPTDIARVLEAEGLPRDFQDLHLLTCGSGLEGLRDKSSKDWQPDDEKFRKSYAKRVYDILKARGYRFIHVTGYLGDVSLGVGDTGDGFAEK